MTFTRCNNNAAITSSAINNVIDIPQISSGSTITNLVVKSMTSAVEFYSNVLDMDIVQYSSRCVIITNGFMTICLTTREHASDIFGFDMSAIDSCHRDKGVIATFVCDDVSAIWNASMAFGATSIKEPVTSANNVTSAILQDPDHYTIVLKSNTSLLQ